MSHLSRILLTLSAIFAFSGAATAGDWGHDRHHRGHHGKHYGHHRHYDSRVSFHFSTWNPYPVRRYVSAPVYVQPAPVYVQPTPVVIQQPAAYCREVESIANIGGNFRRIYGTACMQPDGSWQTVQR